MKFNLKYSIDILSRTPDVLNTWLLKLPSEWILENEGPETWSAYDIVGHLIHGEKTDWIPRARIILAGNREAIFEPFDRFAQLENSKDKSIEQLLEEFKILRLANILALQSFHLGEKELQMTAVHPELGRVDLSQLLSCWTVHDLSHINQIARVIASQHKYEVGPWTAYLGILNAK